MKECTNLRKVAMIGCGFVGSASVFALMQSGLYSEIVLIDADKEKAYILCSDIFEEVNTEYIILFDIETDTYKTIEIPSAYCAEIKFAYVDSGILYMVSKSGSIIKIIV